MPTPSLTIGIEEEYQIIDPATREVSSYVQRFLEQGQTVLPDQIRPEFLQSQVEAGTCICHNIREARRELTRVRRSIWTLAEREGLWVAAAGTHPFSSWTRQEVSPFGRYPELARFLQDVGRRLLIFGMHVHIGIEDRDLLIDVMNQIRYFLPHVLALADKGWRRALRDDPPLRRGLIICEGRVTQPAVAQALGYDLTPAEDLLGRD